MLIQLHTHTHTKGQCSVANPPCMLMEGWEETGEPRANAFKHRENVHRNSTLTVTSGDQDWTQYPRAVRQQCLQIVLQINFKLDLMCSVSGKFRDRKLYGSKYTLSGHFIRNTILALVRASLCSQNNFNSSRHGYH